MSVSQSCAYIPQHLTLGLCQGAAWCLIPLGSQDSSVLAHPVTSLSSTSIHIIFLFLSLLFLIYFFVLYWSKVYLQSYQFQVYSKVIQLYIYICINTYLFRFLSHIGQDRVLSRVPYAIQQVLVDYLFYVQQCVYVNPKLLIWGIIPNS